VRTFKGITRRNGFMRFTRGGENERSLAIFKEQIGGSQRSDGAGRAAAG
jgi:hypothetical protein